MFHPEDMHRKHLKKNRGTNSLENDVSDLKKINPYFALNVLLKKVFLKGNFT